MTDKPVVWVVARHFGVDSQTWLWRQTVAFREVYPRIVSWARFNANHYPIPSEQIDLVPFDEEPNDGIGRFIHRFRSLNTGNYYGAVGRERQWLTQLAKKDPPDAILCHFGHTALRVLPITEALKIPLVAHFHGLDLSSMLGNKWYRWSLLRHLPRFKDVIVVGTHQRKWMLAHGMPEHRVHLIPCGVPTSEFVPCDIPHRDEIRFVIVSRLAEFKGVDYSLRAFAMILLEFPLARMVIIGEGPEMSRLKELVLDRGLEGSVEMTGSLPVAAVRRHMQDSDIFLQHSLVGQNGWVEGFGVSIAEAAACGLPVVVSDCGGIVDQVVDGKTGFVVAQRDLDGMASAMRRLASDKQLRNRMGTAGRDRMVTLFDTSTQVQKLERVLLAAIR